MTVEPILTFTVPGSPAPQGSKRHVGGGRMVESSKAVGPWRERVAIAAHNAMTAARLPMFTGTPVTVRVEFVMPRPASTPKRITPAAVKRPDLDKLVRAVFDACTDVVWADDSAVVDVRASKRLAEPGEAPCALLRIAATQGHAAAGENPSTALPDASNGYCLRCGNPYPHDCLRAEGT